MSIHTADALMGIFGFKRVANYEIKLDNPPSLDDDGGSLNEGMKMEEATNIPSSIDCWACGTYMTLDEHSENDGYCPECNAEIDLDPYLAKALAGCAVRDSRISTLEFELEVAKTDELSAAVWAATETIKHDLWDAQAEIVKRDARIAEIEDGQSADMFLTLTGEITQLRAELALSKAAYESAEDDHTKACAELADAKETISRYETTAENCEVLRAV